MKKVAWLCNVLIKASDV